MMKALGNRIITECRRVLLAILAGFITLAPAPNVFAADAATSAPTTTTACTPVATPPQGIARPTGSDSGTYTYNSCTGLWENSYYVWSPATQEATPKTPLVYTCNQTTWKWVTQEWVYDPAAGAFEQVAISVAQLPVGAIIATNSLLNCAPPPVTSNNPTTPTAAPQSNSAITAPVNGASNINNATQSPSVVSTNGSTTGINSGNSVVLGNQIGTMSTSGDSGVIGNAAAGDATTGNSTAVANVINAVQSSSPILGGHVATFVANINGDVQGDLLIDPNQLQPASGSTALNNTNKLTVNTKNSGQINNNIDVGSKSGDATVATNAQAGNAQSGNATTVADVVNMLDSIVSAGKSFVGVVNINGNMNGNILVPQSFLDSLIASNAPSTTLTLSANDAKSLGITNSNNSAITNNLSNTATTGAATVADNTSAGNATTGDASTKVTVFNLTGSQVVGANCLLVFVNVAGKWVGVIMNAPAGATAAALGGGITQDTTNNAAVNNQTNDAINNNIHLAAASGNATVEDNTKAGNARTGNAETAANLLNLDNSQLSLSGWFGILFINIFGNWYGSFGVYTPPVASNKSDGSGAASTESSATHTQAPTNQPRMFEYVPHDTPQAYMADATSTVPSFGSTMQLTSQTSQVLGSKVVWHSAQTKQATSKTFLAAHEAQVLGGVLVAIGIVMLIGERVFSIRVARKVQVK